MDINDFIKKIENEIEEITPGALKPDTNYRDIAGWSSMHALIIIALIDTEYNVTITGGDIRNSQTVTDLFTIIKSRV